MAQRKRQRKRNFKKRKGPSNKTLNKKIKHIENNLIELKWFDVFRASTDATVAGVQDYLTAIPQGDTALTRTGNVIAPTSVQCRITLFSSNTQLNADQRVRYIVFWDRQANGAVPVLTGGPTTQSLLDIGTITDPTLCPRNYNTIERFKILKDKLVTLTPQIALRTTLTGANDDLVTSMPVTKTFIHHIKLSRMVKYNDAAAGIASAVTNALHFCFLTDLASSGGLQAGFRVYFKDA